jgi:hypothetical protein
MNATNLKHFVVTRLSIGTHNVDWYPSTLGLFEAIALPSLRVQSSSAPPDLNQFDKAWQARRYERNAGSLRTRRHNADGH